MAIKIQGDNMQYGDTAIATLSTDALTLQSGTSLNAQKLTASNGMEVTNHMTAENGIVNVSGQLTASHGMRIFDGLTLAALNNNPADLMFTNAGSMECYGSAAFTAATFSVSADFAAGTVVTAAGKVTASNGMEITNHMVANNGVVTVSGQLTASNGLAVSGDVSFEDASFSGDVTLGNAATDVTTITGQLTASNGIKIVGDSQIGVNGLTDNTLTVYSPSNFMQRAYFNDQLTASNGLLVNSGGEFTVASTVETTLNGPVDLNGTLTASNGIYLASTGELLSSAPVDFRNDITLGYYAGNTITVPGRFGSDLIPSVFSTYDLGTSDDQWAEAHVDHGHIDDITSTGTSNLFTVNVTGKLTASNGLAVSGDVSFEDATFSGDVSLGDGRTDTITVNGIATFTEQLTASNGIAVDGDATFAQRTTFSGVTTVNAHLTASAGIRSNGSSWFGEEVEVVGDLQVNSNVTLGNASSDVATITGQLTASNGARIAGNVVLGSDDSIKAGSYITYSDATLKENIEVISNPIDKVMSMRGVTYNFKTNSENSEVGFLAQEMKQAVPEVVYGNGDGNLGIDYAKLTSVLVEAIKTQQTQIQEQQSQIDELKESLLKK